MLTFSHSLEIGSALAVLRGLDFNEFLGGRGRPETEISVDDIFAGTLEGALEALSSDYDIPLDLDDPTAQPDWEVVGTLREYEFVLPQDEEGCCWAGVAAIDDCGTIVGAYTGCSLAVAPEHRERGLGSALVALRFLLDESLPLWEHDEAGYSRAGHAAHLSAYRFLSSMAETSQT